MTKVTKVTKIETPVTPEIDLTTFTTKSSKIRHLSSLGKTRSEIAKMLDIRYQHVRNVLTQPLKKV